MNLFKKFALNFGSVDGALAFLAMNGIQVTKGRYNEWLTGKRLPRAEVLNIILTTVTDVNLEPATTKPQKPTVTIALNHTIPVEELRRKLPHRRFSADYWQQVRLVDAQVLEAVHGHDVWTRFEAMCGNFNNALYVLRRNCTGRRITADWLQNRLDTGWYPDTVNTMVELLERYEGTGTAFNAIGVQTMADIRAYVRQFAMMANPQCDYDAIPDDVVMQLYKDMNGAG